MSAENESKLVVGTASGNPEGEKGILRRPVRLMFELPPKLCAQRFGHLSKPCTDILHYPDAEHPAYGEQSLDTSEGREACLETKKWLVYDWDTRKFAIIHAGRETVNQNRKGGPLMHEPTEAADAIYRSTMFSKVMEERQMRLKRTCLSDSDFNLETILCSMLAEDRHHGLPDTKFPTVDEFRSILNNAPCKDGSHYPTEDGAVAKSPLDIPENRKLCHATFRAFQVGGLHDLQDLGSYHGDRSDWTLAGVNAQSDDRASAPLPLPEEREEGNGLEKGTVQEDNEGTPDGKGWIGLWTRFLTFSPFSLFGVTAGPQAMQQTEDGMSKEWEFVEKQ